MYTYKVYYNILLNGDFFFNLYATVPSIYRYLKIIRKSLSYVNVIQNVH